jgi:predicted regulator of Ras-like GTPase activity (Roadblock/LC7/MglB family)
MQTRSLHCDPKVLELLDEIVAVYGVDQVAVTDGGGDFLANRSSEGCPDDAMQTLSAVLAEAVLSSAAALAGRCGVGEPEDIHLQCGSGGLLLRPINEEQLLMVRYNPGTRSGLLRLVVRKTAAQLAATIGKTLGNLTPAGGADLAPPTMPISKGITSLRDAISDSWTGF